MGAEVTEERVDLYRRLLDLAPDADIDDVQRCYRKAMSDFHPDMRAGDEETAKLLNEARDFFVSHPSKTRAASSPQKARVEPRPPSTTRAETSPPHPRPQAPPRPASQAAPSARPAPRPTVSVTPPVAVGRRRARWTAGEVFGNVAGGAWIAVTGAITILKWLVIIYFVLVAIELVIWFFSTVLPWMRGILG